MRVLLVSTPHPLEENPIPPLSLSYLAAALAQEGVEVQVLDFLVTRYSKCVLQERLEAFRPDVVGITCVTLNFPTASRIVRACKEFDPGMTTVVGGPHVSFSVEDSFRRAPWIDIIVRGEGDQTAVELVEALEQGSDLEHVAGIAFRRDGAVVLTAPRSLIPDLDGLPMPARHLLPLSRYRALGSPCTVITSRGCPFGCVFCSARGMFGRGVRLRTPRLVVDEIEAVNRQLGFDAINIVDDTFTANPRHAREVCDEIARRGLEFEWSVYSRVDTITPDMARAMKEAGCVCVLFGIESADEGILKTINKGITVDQVRAGVGTAREAGLNVFNSFIMGLPGETPETARHSMAFARELNRDYGANFGFHILAPLPGTALYDEAERFGLRILTRDWARYDANEPITETVTMGPGDVLEAMADYDRGIAAVWEEMKRRTEAGDPTFEKEVRRRETKEFVWRLLKDDVIARVGWFRYRDDGVPAEQRLAQRVSQRLAVPTELAAREVEGLVRRGLIVSEQVGGGYTWRWS
ncbi:MAG: radical SAM protein [Chloroflexota bacterium]|nr:radical SAM protein [Chloroflexota bacterium]